MTGDPLAAGRPAPIDAGSGGAGASDPTEQVPGLSLRPARPADAALLGRICYEAFRSITARHNYPNDLPSVERATATLTSLLEHPGFFGVVAELDGRLVGSNFLDERSNIAGVGPVTVDPTVQDRGVGRRLMEAALERAAARRFAGVRLVQAAYHTRSLALYAKLGFQVRALLACLQGPPLGLTIPGRAVRPAAETDLEACNRLSRSVHGFERGADLLDAVRRGTALVVEHDRRISGYATALALSGHAVGETDDDLKALIGAAPTFGGAGFLLPAASPLLGWSLDQGLRVVQLMTLMSVGLYNEPAGSYLPSILF